MTDRDDQQLRNAVLSASELAGDGSSCPEAEELRASARGTLSGSDQQRVVLHLGECGACAVAWRVARELTPAAPASRRPFYVLAAAAVLVMVASASFYLFQERELPPPPPTFRNQESRWLLNETGDAPLPRDRFLLKWTAGPEGTAYDLRVTEENLEIVHRANGLEAATHTIPPVALQDLSSGTRLLWQVTARLPDGQRVDSETFVARVE